MSIICDGRLLGEPSGLPLEAESNRIAAASHDQPSYDTPRVPPEGDGTYRHDAPVPTLPIADLPGYMQPRQMAGQMADVRHPALRPQAPTIGRIVRYRLHAGAVEDINCRLQASQHNFTWEQYMTGSCAGNRVDEGQEVAAIIVAVHPYDLVNLQLMLDGNFSHWVTSVALGEGPGTWSWPERS